MAEINWTRESEIWLHDIYNYIAADNPHAAARTINEIYEKAQLLKISRGSATNTSLSKTGRSEFSCTSTTGLPIY